MQLQIKAQTLPSRCELCHQSDLFDPEKNFCSRCGDLANYQSRDEAIRTQYRPITLRPRTFLLSYLSGAVSFKLFILTLLYLISPRSILDTGLLITFAFLSLTYGGAMGIAVKAIYEDMKQRIHWWRWRKNSREHHSTPSQ